MTFFEYATGFTAGVLAVALLACGAAVDSPAPLPANCTIQTEEVRIQICPRQSAAVVCSDVAQTNFDPRYCEGPDWTEGHQVTGNGWCCDY